MNVDQKLLFVHDQRSYATARHGTVDGAAQSTARPSAPCCLGCYSIARLAEKWCGLAPLAM